MARDSSGTHTLPSGQPVVAGTTITATAHNAAMADLSAEVTDSLSRSGKGGMTAPLRVADGTVAAPAVSFTSDTDTEVLAHLSGCDGLFFEANHDLDMLRAGSYPSSAGRVLRRVDSPGRGAYVPVGPRCQWRARHEGTSAAASAARQCSGT